MSDFLLNEHNLESKVLFKGEFNNTRYELRSDGLYVDGEISKNTISAIRRRISYIFSDELHKEHKNFARTVSYMDLWDALKK